MCIPEKFKLSSSNNDTSDGDENPQVVNNYWTSSDPKFEEDIDEFVNEPGVEHDTLASQNLD